MILKKTFLILVGFFLMFNVASAQTLSAIDTNQKSFFVKISKISKRLLEINTKTLSKLRKVNQSYRNTQQAIKHLSKGGAPHEVQDFLKKAIRFYPDNSFAHLYLGALLEDEGNIEEAATHYHSFYEKSLFPTKVDREFIRVVDAAGIRGYLEIWFKENEIVQEKIEPPQWFKFSRGLNRLSAFPSESLLGLLLTLIAFGGFAFLLFYNAIFRYESKLFRHPLAKFFLKLYYVFTFAYLSWLIHLYLGITPLLKTHIRQTYWILALGTALIIFFELASILKEKKEIQEDPDLKVCPHCKKPVMKLAQECPACGKLIED